MVALEYQPVAGAFLAFLFDALRCRGTQFLCQRLILQTVAGCHIHYFENNYSRDFLFCARERAKNL